MIRPVDIATKHSVDFIRAYAPTKCEMLEIGCGEGDVAQKLQSFGFKVTAIDTDDAAVARAREKSVNAAVARWPDFQSELFDAVLFTRSLHHMHDLKAAIAAAKLRLHPDGLLLVEDFAFDEADARTSRWFADQLRARPVAKMLVPPKDSFIAKVLGAERPHDAWHSNHGHDLHSAETMRTEIAAQLSVKNAVSAPYLYRYLIPALPETPKAAALLEDFLNKEEQMIASGDIVSIGRRVIASHD